jgi:hypothetical protein
MRDDRARLCDMLTSIGNIERYASYGRDRFLNDDLIRTYIVHHLQILGEAAATNGSRHTGSFLGRVREPLFCRNASATLPSLSLVFP